MLAGATVSNKGWNLGDGEDLHISSRLRRDASDPFAALRTNNATKALTLRWSSIGSSGSSIRRRGVRGTARGHGATFDASNSDGADPANVHAAIASLADMVAAHLDSAMPENMAPDASRPPLNAN